MKQVIICLFGVIALMSSSCNNGETGHTVVYTEDPRVDSLIKRMDRLESTLKPGLSTLMNQMQLHHGRMWEPGITGNWKLATYEYKETREIMEGIELLYGNQPYSGTTIKQHLDNLEPVLDSLRDALRASNKDEFVNSYNSLTFQCNACHKASGFDFYEIITPKKPAYSGISE